MPRKPTISKVALTDQVTSVLEERILDGIYGPGERLNIDALTREFQVSSSPVREALTRLSALGLVATSSFAGFSVSAVPSREWFEQLLQYRIIAEGWAARQLARRRIPGVLDRMADTIAAMETGTLGRHARDFIPCNRADEMFHEMMLDASGNEVLAQSVRNLRPHLHHARLFAKVPQEVGPVVGEHRAILDAAMRGDEDGAAAALEAHLRASWRRYDGWLAEFDDTGGGQA